MTINQLVFLFFMQNFDYFNKLRKSLFVFPCKMLTRNLLYSVALMFIWLTVVFQKWLKVILLFQLC